MQPGGKCPILVPFPLVVPPNTLAFCVRHKTWDSQSRDRIRPGCLFECRENEDTSFSGHAKAKTDSQKISLPLPGAALRATSGISTLNAQTVEKYSEKAWHNEKTDSARRNW